MVDIQGIVVCLCGVVALGWGEEACPEGQAALYKMTFQALWSPMMFPRHYPRYRPHAQWSKIIGRTHGEETSLWRLQERASPAFKEFAETGQTSLFDLQMQGNGGIQDIFVLPRIRKGIGALKTSFIADSQHSQLSLAAKLIPSPDWFVGLDSLSLCEGGDWVEKKSITLTPLDAGTQRGVLFSAPKWPERQQKEISEILSRPPAHPASSFFYPDKRKMPTIARVILWRETVYGDGTKVKAEKASRADNARDQPANDVTEVITTTETATLPPTLDCVVSDFSDWSPCSRSCGFGKTLRRRTVIQQAKPGGAPCPKLIHGKICGSMRNCEWTHFSSNRWGNAKAKLSAQNKLRNRRRFRRRPRKERKEGH